MLIGVVFVVFVVVVVVVSTANGVHGQIIYINLPHPGRSKMLS